MGRADRPSSLTHGCRCKCPGPPIPKAKHGGFGGLRLLCPLFAAVIAISDFIQLIDMKEKYHRATPPPIFPL
jgi:hypothetical protein